MNRAKLRLLTSAVLFTGWLPSQAYAQSVASPTSPNTGATNPADTAANGVSPGLQDIIVTARRRSENLQDTPVSITAFSGEVLKALNILDLPRIANFTPGLQLTQLPGSAGIGVTLRGISVSDAILTNEPSIGLYIDGVYQNPVAAGKADLLDIEQIQVLRGPQGTLFGRNTTAGAILITTSRPSVKSGVDIRLSYGTNNDILGRISINTGDIIPGWRAMLTYQRRQNDGWVNNTDAPGNLDPGASRSDSGRLAIHGEIGKLMIDYTGSLVRRRDVPPHNQIIYATPAYASLGPTSVALGGDTLRISPDFLSTIRFPVVPPNKGDTTDHALNLAYSISPALTLKSISGWRKFDNREQYLFGSTAGLTLPTLDPTTFQYAGIQSGLLPNNSSQMRSYNQFSQELQAAGKIDRIEYTTGLYYYNFRYFENQPQSYLDAVQTPEETFGIVFPARLQYSGQTQSYAAFAQASYTPPILGDGLELTGGIRYTKDKKSVVSMVFPESGPVSHGGSQTFNNTSYNVTLNYKLAPDVRIYLRQGTGYRAGGFNARSFDGPPYQPEIATVYEAGLKSEFFDHIARFNAAIYQTDYKNFQTGGPTREDPSAGFVSDTINAGKARYRGFEAELTVAPMRSLTLTSDVAYVDPKFLSFELGGVDVANIAHFTYYSKWQYHLGGRYEIAATSIGTVAFNVDYSYKSSRYFVTFRPVSAPATGPDPSEGNPQNELSARLSLSEIKVAGAKVEIAVFGQNLTNAHYTTAAVDFGALGFITAPFNRPRVVGVDLRTGF